MLGIGSQFNNVYSTCQDIIIKIALTPPPPSAILIEKTKLHGKNDMKTKDCDFMFFLSWWGFTPLPPILTMSSWKNIVR